MSLQQLISERPQARVNGAEKVSQADLEGCLCLDCREAYGEREPCFEINQLTII